MYAMVLVAGVLSALLISVLMLGPRQADSMGPESPMPVVELAPIPTTSSRRPQLTIHCPETWDTRSIVTVECIGIPPSHPHTYSIRADAAPGGVTFSSDFFLTCTKPGFHDMNLHYATAPDGADVPKGVRRYRLWQQAAPAITLSHEVDMTCLRAGEIVLEDGPPVTTPQPVSPWLSSNTYLPRVIMYMASSATSDEELDVLVRLFSHSDATFDSVLEHVKKSSKWFQALILANLQSERPLTSDQLVAYRRVLSETRSDLVRQNLKTLGQLV